MTYQVRQDGFFPVLQDMREAVSSVVFFDAGKDAVLHTLNKGRLDLSDLAILLSPAASELLEEIAQRAHGETLRHFGKSVQLFAPLYLADFCTNSCVYCGFHAGSKITRKMLSFDEVEEEARTLAATGLRRVLCLTGDAPKKTGPVYLAECIRRIGKYIPSVSIEVPAMQSEEYASISSAGADAMTMFQETYDQERYAYLHPAGPKRDFFFRLDAPQRAVLGGMRGLTLGVLLGLSDWRRDAFFLGAHISWLNSIFPQIELSFSLPRIRPAVDTAPTFTATPVPDRDFVQAMLALRCFLPHVGNTLSTRESAFMRDKLVSLGVTRLSAGVRTSVGGYAAVCKGEPVQGIGSFCADKAGSFEDPVQFVIDDERSVNEVAAALRAMGYQPVFSDWLLPEAGKLPLSESLQRNLGQSVENKTVAGGI